MVKDYSSSYYIAILILGVFVSVMISLLSLSNKNKIKINNYIAISLSNSKWMITLLAFLIYFFLPSDAVNDYIGYANYYIERQLNSYGSSYGYFSSRDLLFFNYVEILSSLNINYRLAYGLIVAFYIFVLSQIATRYRVNTWFVFLLVITFGHIYFVVSGLRQAAAMGFLLLAYRYYLDKRWFQVIGLIFLAAGFHSSGFLGALLIWSFLYLAKLHRVKDILIILCFVSLPLLFGQLQGKSIINIALPYIAFLISEQYSGYVDLVDIFKVSDSFGLGFVFFTLAKIYFLVLVLFLSLKNKLNKEEDLVIIIALAYVLLFNIFGLNEYTQRILQYLAPFLFIAMPLVISRGASFSMLLRQIGIVFLIASGALVVVTLFR